LRPPPPPALFPYTTLFRSLKLLSAHYPPMEVTVLRGAASLPFMLLPLLVTGRWRELRMRRFPMHLLRGLLGVVALGGFVYERQRDRKSTRLNSSHVAISYA